MYRKEKNDDNHQKGLTVTVRNNDVNGALRVLKKRLIKDGLFQELRERSYFESKGTKRRKRKQRQLVDSSVKWKNAKKNLVTKRMR